MSNDKVFKKIKKLIEAKVPEVIQIILKECGFDSEGILFNFAIVLSSILESEHFESKPLLSRMFMISGCIFSFIVFSKSLKILFED